MIVLLGTIVSGILLWFDLLSAYAFIVSIIVLVLVEVFGAVAYFQLGWFKFYYHDVLAWHTPEEESRWYDGYSDHAICRHCGEDILQDSQGNWFTVR